MDVFIRRTFGASPPSPRDGSGLYPLLTKSFQTQPVWHQRNFSMQLVEFLTALWMHIRVPKSELPVDSTNAITNITRYHEHWQWIWLPYWAIWAPLNETILGPDASASSASDHLVSMNHRRSFALICDVFDLPFLNNESFGDLFWWTRSLLLVKSSFFCLFFQFLIIIKMVKDKTVDCCISMDDEGQLCGVVFCYRQCGCFPTMCCTLDNDGHVWVFL
jgi:hypothetical protein